MESDLLLGNNNDDLMDDDYDAHMNVNSGNVRNERPNTVGAGYNTRSAAQQQQQQQQPLPAGTIPFNAHYIVTDIICFSSNTVLLQSATIKKEIYFEQTYYDKLVIKNIIGNFIIV